MKNWWKRETKIGKKCISGESHDEGAFTVFELIFNKQVQFKMFIYRVVDNSMGYPNI